jgi:TP901 family phage tail tape measure protein
MSNPIVNRTVNIYINDASAQKAMQNLQLQADRLSKKIEEGNKKGKDMTAEMTRLGDTQKKMKELSDVIDGKLNPSFNMVKQRVGELTREVNKLHSGTKEFTDKKAELDRVTEAFNRMKADINGVNGAIKNTSSNKFWDIVKGVAIGTIVGNTVQAATEKISGYFSSLVSGNAKLSDELAAIEKTSGLSAEKVKELNSELSKLNTRTKTSDLREIAVGLGQIGEAVTAENVANIDKIVVALGDEFNSNANDITTTLGVLRNNLQDIKTGNYGDDVLHIGNALNVLGKEGLATAPVVVGFATRLSGVLQTMGATSGQILGLSATMQELGISEERGATGVVKIIQRITADTDKFAQVIKAAGMDSDKFYKLVNTDIVGALVMASEAAKKAGSTNENFGRILKDLDTTGAGVGEVLAKLSSNSDLLANKIDLASTALTKSNSITDQYNIKNNNLAATLEKIEKRLASIFMNAALMEGLSGFVNGFAKLIGAVDDTDSSINNLKAHMAEVAENENKLNPLIATYDELATKQNKSTEEQAALNKAIAELGQAIPGAITQFDQYGKAIAINTDIAKEYLRIKRLILQEENKDTIAKVHDELNKATRDLSETQEKRNRATLLFQRAVNDNNAHYMQLHEKQINLLDADASKLKDKIDGLKGKLNELNGNPLVEVNSTITINSPRENKITKGSSSKVLTDEEIKAAQTKADRIKELKVEMATMIADVKAMMDDSARGDDARDLQQIQHTIDKYRKLMEEAKKYGISYVGLTKAQYQEIALLTQQQFENRSSKEYTAALKDSKDYFDNERQTAYQAYADRLIDKKIFDTRLKNIDEHEASARVQIALDYSSNVKKAEEDVQQSRTDAAKKGAAERDMIDSIAAKNTKDNMEKLKLWIQFYGELASTFSMAMRMMDDRARASFDKEVQQNEQKKASWKKMLDNKTMSQAEYDKRVANADAVIAKKDKELKLQEWKHNHASQLANQSVLLAQAISRAWAMHAENPGLAATIAAITAGIIGAQTVMIAAQKPPTFATGRMPLGSGGVPDGPSHAGGGINLVTPGGQIVGNMEGDEPILSKQTYLNNRALVDMLLYSSMKMGGKNISWLYAQPASISTSSLLSSGYYANGGMMNASSSNASSSNAPSIYPKEMMEVLTKLSQQLEQPLSANVVYMDLLKKQQEYDQLKKWGSFKTS